MPTTDNRWCTGLKIGAVENYIKELSRNGNVLVVIGDRDAEAIHRLQKPFIEKESENLIRVYPIRLWSTAMVQAYLRYSKLPLNRLYELGFYRIGCYICPALRSWELRVMLKNKIHERIGCTRCFIEFLKSKGVGLVDTS